MIKSKLYNKNYLNNYLNNNNKNRNKFKVEIYIYTIIKFFSSIYLLIMIFHPFPYDLDRQKIQAFLPSCSSISISPHLCHMNFLVQYTILKQQVSMRPITNESSCGHGTVLMLILSKIFSK